MITSYFTEVNVNNTNANNFYSISSSEGLTLIQEYLLALHMYMPPQCLLRLRANYIIEKNLECNDMT